MIVIREGGCPDQLAGGSVWRGRGGPWRRRSERIPDFQRPDSAALAGHARLFIHPAYARLVNSEPYVKRLIPLLIILFVVALGAMRGVALYQAHAEIANTSAELQLALIAKAVTSDLAGSSLPRLARPSRRKCCRGSSRTRSPSARDHGGQAIFVIDPQGRSSPMAPRRAELVGRYLDEMLGPSQPLTTLGEQRRRDAARRSPPARR